MERGKPYASLSKSQKRKRIRMFFENESDKSVANHSKKEKKSMSSSVNLDKDLDNDNHSYDAVKSRSPSPTTNSSNFCTTHCSENLTADLSLWLLREKQISHDGVDRLLQILSQHFTVPKSVKTLIHKPHNNPILPMYHGQYVHFNNWSCNILESVRSEIQAVNNESIFSIKLMVNIDGIPLNNPLGVSKYAAYPILLKIKDWPNSKIFCAGIYISDNYEKKDMPPPNIMLQNFFDDINRVNDQNHVYNNVSYKFMVYAFICDAPVRAALKNIFQHSGYNSCERCAVRGEYHSHTVVFLNCYCERRSDESFKERSHESHHKSADLNILEQNGVLMVSSFILDVMHLCYIGVMKRIINWLLNSKVKQRSVKLGRYSRQEFKLKLIGYQEYIPAEFNRKLEGDLSTILKWKASQYRMFALYVGIVLLNDEKIVSKKLYEHFLKFSIALRLMNTKEEICNIDFIRKILIQFVEEAKTLYGPSFVSYNVHNLIHLPDDYETHGPLDKMSAFNFESYLGSHIKGAVRAGNKPLHQIADHVAVINCDSPKTTTKSNIKFFRKNLNCYHDFDGICYHKMMDNNGITITTNEYCKANSYLSLKNGDIGKVTAIHKHNNDVTIMLTKTRKTSLFKIPMDSSDIGIHVLKVLDGSMHVNLSEIDRKYFILPYRKTKSIAMRMLDF